MYSKFIEYMKKITIYTITALLTLQLGACRMGKDEVEQKTPEQIRLEQATHIDTISLCMRVNPDTIDGAQQTGFVISRCMDADRRLDRYGDFGQERL